MAADVALRPAYAMRDAAGKAAALDELADLIAAAERPVQVARPGAIGPDGERDMVRQ